MGEADVECLLTGSTGGFCGTVDCTLIFVISDVDILSKNEK